VEKDVPKEHLDHLHNLVAAVFLLERQQVEEGLAQAIMKVIDYLKVEDQPAIRDLQQVFEKREAFQKPALQLLENLRFSAQLQRSRYDAKAAFGFCIVPFGLDN
jgi:hypothetical protein